MVRIQKNSDGSETLEDYNEEISDPLCKMFADLYLSLPEKDHVSATRVLQREGVFKRLQDSLSSWRHKEAMTSNVFAPTGALEVIQHLKQVVPDHCLVLADFDSFIYPRNSIRGVNAPLVTNKLKDPTQWQTFDTYLIKRGEADICFPVNFNFLQHAYQQLTGFHARVLKTAEFVDQYALRSWCTTQNMYNPMREEYFNTSIMVTDSLR